MEDRGVRAGLGNLDAGADDIEVFRSHYTASERKSRTPRRSPATGGRTGEGKEIECVEFQVLADRNRGNGPILIG